jgi:hypothetical protein
VIVGAGLALLAAGPVASAGADPCPLTDPLCVIETPEDTVDQTVDAVKDQAGTAVDTVQKTVKDLTDPADDPGGGGGGAGNDDQQGSGKGNGSDRRGPDGRSTPPNVGVVPTTGTGGTTLVPTTVGENVPVAQIDEETPILSRDLPAALREAVVGHALPLLLVMGIVVGFTMFQNHLDRRDPKLALAPLSADVLRFT